MASVYCVKHYVKFRMILNKGSNLLPSKTLAIAQFFVNFPYFTGFRAYGQICTK